jgi:hypothetical protein
MSEIKVGPRAQAIMLLALIAGVVAAIGVQLPEIRRYLKVRSM